MRVNIAHLKNIKLDVARPAEFVLPNVRSDGNEANFLVDYVVGQCMIQLQDLAIQRRPSSCLAYNLSGYLFKHVPR